MALQPPSLMLAAASPCVVLVDFHMDDSLATRAGEVLLVKNIVAHISANQFVAVRVQSRLLMIPLQQGFQLSYAVFGGASTSINAIRPESECVPAFVARHQPP